MYNIYATNYIGPRYTNCDPTGAQKSALGADSSFRKTLTGSYNTDFSESQGLFNELHGGLTAIEAKGPSQEGMSPAEKAAENSQALNSAAAANKNVQAAIGAKAGMSNANPGVESGVTEAVRAGAATQVASNLANKQSQIVERSYDIGRENYNTATKELEALPSATMSPVTQAGEAAVGSEKVENEQANTNAAASSSWMGLVGGLADSAVGGLTGGLTKMIGGGKKNG